MEKKIADIYGENCGLANISGNINIVIYGIYKFREKCIMEKTARMEYTLLQLLDFHH